MKQILKSIGYVAGAGAVVLHLATSAAAQEADLAAEMGVLGDCKGCVLEGADYSETRLMGINLSEATVTETLFNRAALSISVFDGATLNGVNFSGADLRGATFIGTRMIDVTFEGANLKGAVFEGAFFERTDVEKGLLCNTQMSDDRMENSDCD